MEREQNQIKSNDIKKPQMVKKKSSVSLTPQDFNIKHTLGRGAYGYVYLASKISDKKQFAMKQIQKRKLEKQHKQYQALIEKQMLAVLKHPAIIKMHYAFQDKKTLYFILQLCEGGQFLQFIKLNISQLNEDIKRFYIAQIVNILEYLHKNGVTHRDIKPQNLMLSNTGHLKIIDFGTAQITKCSLISNSFKQKIQKMKSKAKQQNQREELQQDQVQQDQSPKKKQRRSTFVGSFIYLQSYYNKIIVLLKLTYGHLVVQYINYIIFKHLLKIIMNSQFTKRQRNVIFNFQRIIKLQILRFNNVINFLIKNKYHSRQIRQWHTIWTQFNKNQENLKAILEAIRNNYLNKLLKQIIKDFPQINYYLLTVQLLLFEYLDSYIQIIDLIKKLLKKNPDQRLGSGKTQQLTYQKLKQHPYFTGLDVDKVFQMQVPRIQQLKQPIIDQQTMGQIQQKKQKTKTQFNKQMILQMNSIQQKTKDKKILIHGMIEKKTFIKYSFYYLIIYDDLSIDRTKAQQPQKKRDYYISIQQTELPAKFIDKGRFQVKTTQKSYSLKCQNNAQQWVKTINQRFLQLKNKK